MERGSLTLFMAKKRTQISATKKEIIVSKAEERRMIIDRLYARCRYCNFFFLRKFPGDDLCDSPKCLMRDEADSSEPV